MTWCKNCVKPVSTSLNTIVWKIFMPHLLSPNYTPCHKNISFTLLYIYTIINIYSFVHYTCDFTFRIFTNKHNIQPSSLFTILFKTYFTKLNYQGCKTYKLKIFVLLWITTTAPVQCCSSLLLVMLWLLFRSNTVLLKHKFNRISSLHLWGELRHCVLVNVIPIWDQRK